jgi:hypothetical protein
MAKTNFISSTVYPTSFIMALSNNKFGVQTPAVVGKPSLKDMNTHKSTCYLIVPLLVEDLQV